MAAPGFQDFAHIRENQTRISLPVRGVAHKVEGHGASPAIVIEEYQDVRFEDMNVWSAPLFAVNVARNRGECIFRRFNICPKPGTGRLTSSWRDGFHVKGNYARLLWEDCHLEGMNDDAFNIATPFLASRRGTVTHDEMRIRQNFPLGVRSVSNGRYARGLRRLRRELLGEAKVIRAVAEGAVDAVHPDRPAPQYRLTLDRAMVGIAKGDLVGTNPTRPNPNTTLRRCKIFNS